MGFNKITDTDIEEYPGVINLNDVPGLSGTAMRAKFEETTRSLVIPRFNQLIDEMAESMAAACVGAVMPALLAGEDVDSTVQAVVDAVLESLTTHKNNQDNPHGVTAAQVGAYSVSETDAQINAKVEEIGSADMAKNEFATNGEYGKVDAAVIADELKKKVLDITVVKSDGAAATDAVITVEELTTGEQIAQFTYGGEPEAIQILTGLSYIVKADAIEGYLAPLTVLGVATADREMTVTYTRCHRYGYARAKANSDPSARISYLYDAVDSTPAAMNLSTNVMDYGSWGDLCEEIATPVMIKTDGTEDYELDRDDQGKKADGTDSDVANTAYAGNAMVRFGNCLQYVYRYEDDDNEYVIFSDGKYDENYKADAHTNADGEIADNFYWGMYKGSYSSSKLRSLAGQTVMVSTTAAQEVERALVNGDRYYIIYKSGWDYICDLLTLISKSDDSQTCFGSGRSKTTNTAAIATGTLKATGAFWGSSNETSDVKVFYIEGFWGNVWERMAGLLNSYGTVYTKMTPPYAFDTTDYLNTGVTLGGTSGGYLSAASVTDETGFVPKTASGSSATYYTDGLWYNATQLNYAFVGGNWHYGLLCGSRSVHLNFLASNTGTAVGSRLSFVPRTA